MKQFASYLNFRHRKITPYWPQANSHVETFNRRLRKVVQSAKIDGKDWKQELYRFLRNYRVTPHQSTMKSPAKLMFPGRRFRNRLPQLKAKVGDEQVRKRDNLMNNKMKYYGDKNCKEVFFRIGDTVLVRQKKKNKLTPPFDPTPHLITAMKGSMITAKSTKSSNHITRNSSFFKRIRAKSESESDDDDMFEDNAIESTVDVSSGDEPGADELEVIDAENNSGEATQRRMNPPRARRRPAYLRDDIDNLLQVDY